MAVIELKNVRKSFGAVDVIKDVSIRIEDGEFAVFVGPSGCGKSTLLRLIAGLEGLDGGEFLLDGRRMNDIAPDKRGIAMVFQSYALYPHLTVAENIGFSLILQKVAKDEVRRKVEGIAEKLQLTELLDRRPAALSGGQRQRVAIGRAIIKNPSVILFDEPLSNLDASLRVQMRAELQKLHQELEATVIYVTHDQVEAMTMADRIVVLNKGEVAQCDAPISLYNQPQSTFVAGFIGSPKMNLLPGTVAQGEGGLLLACDNGWRVPLQAGSATPGDSLFLGVRPEHLRLAEAGGYEAQVAVVERLGVESFLALEQPGNDPITLRIEGDVAIRPGDALRVNFEMAQCHLFARTSGQVLQNGAQ